MQNHSTKDIEAYTNENKEIVNETPYEYCIKEGSRFKFKPGHKAILLSLPKTLADFLKEPERDRGLTHSTSLLFVAIENLIFLANVKG